jgi:hypothetical protein
VIQADVRRVLDNPAAGRSTESEAAALG